MTYKPNICVDFDGVIHDYKEGWKDGTIYGDVTPGFFEWAIRMSDHFNILVFSSRCKTEEGAKEVSAWLIKKYMCFLWGNYEQTVSGNHSLFEVVDKKPPAVVYIDDRALRFNGDWYAPELSVESISNFKPWNAKISEDIASDYIRGIAAL